MADEDKSLNKLLAMVLIGVLGGAGSSVGLRVVSPPDPSNLTEQQLKNLRNVARPDPWTGTQAREQGARLQAQIDKNTSHRIQHEIQAQRYIYMIEQHEKEIERLKRHFGYDHRSAD